MDVRFSPRFSPRPNRATEIHWRPWNEETFAAARASDRLVLLAIGAVWCHWCHVMDETSYSDEQVITLLNERFIPIRVDNDQRPDVNLRYNLGGWPTTALLTPEGELLTGGTYIPPDRLLLMLRQADSAWETSREEIRGRLAERRPRREADDPATAAPAAPVDVSWDTYETALAAVREEFDPVHAGFGGAPKFPMFQALELAMDAYARTGEDVWREIFTRSLLAMAGGGMYDPVEGGFFRYSTTRDWRIPHYEKMLEDNALLLELLVWAGQLTGDERFTQIAADVMRFLGNTLYQPDTRCWSGSQDADEEYYPLPRGERALRDAPYVDPVVYVEWNALLARALIRYAWATQEPGWQEQALATLTFLADRCFDPERGMARFFEGEPQVWSLLADQTATGQAALLAYQATGEGRWLDLSRQLAAYCLRHLRGRSGALIDGPHDPSAPAALARPKSDFRANADAARWLFHLAALTDASDGSGSPSAEESGFPSADDCRQAAAGITAWGSRFVQDYGLHAAGFALATADALRPWTTVNVVGHAADNATRDLMRVILGAYRPRAVVRHLDPAAAPDAVTARGYTAGPAPEAYVCVGAACLPPVATADQLATLLEGATS